jgi:general secretion pathway protein G
MIVSPRRPNSSGLLTRSAFTLLEVLVVVAILLVLASVGAVYGVRYMEDAKADATRMKMQTLSSSCKAYYNKTGNFPTALTDLIQPPDGNEPFVEGGMDAITDAWGQPINYSLEQPAGGGGEYVPVFRTQHGNRTVVWPNSAR